MRPTPENFCDLCEIAIDKDEDYCETCLEIVSALKPCPFCNAPVFIDSYISKNKVKFPDEFTIQCVNSDCSVRPHVTEESVDEVVKVWDKRPSENVLAEMLEALADEVDQRYDVDDGIPNFHNDMITKALDALEFLRKNKATT